MGAYKLKENLEENNNVDKLQHSVHFTTASPKYTTFIVQVTYNVESYKWLDFVQGLHESIYDNIYDFTVGMCHLCII